nr:prenyltransferase [Planctomycetota bacterium]
YYGAYYAAQGMYQLGGNYWKQWQLVSERLLLAKQSKDGSWPPPPGATHEEQAGTIYTTAMAILSLGVEFRYLPIYQR